jgi:integrase
MKADHKIAWHPRGGWCRRFPGDSNRTYFGRVEPTEAVRAMIKEETRRDTGEADGTKLKNLLLCEAVDLWLVKLDDDHKHGRIGDSHRARCGAEIAILVTVAGKNRKLSDFCQMTAPEYLFKPLREKSLARGIIACEKHVGVVRAFLDWCSSTRRFIAAPFYADAFKLPGEKEKRTKKKSERRAKGTAFWKPEAVREIVEAAKQTDVHRYAQVLLMLNGGMGAKDLSELDDADIDWDRRCIHTDRSKTLVPRVIPLWDLSFDAMRVSRASRPKPSEFTFATRFFLTKRGNPLVVERLDDKRVANLRTDSVKNWFYQLLNGDDRIRWKAPAIRLRHLKRHRGGGYTLRSVFATLSMGHGSDPNLEAVIMGQQFDRPIMEFYIRDEQREKLRVVVEHVRRQIWP